MIYKFLTAEGKTCCESNRLDLLCEACRAEVQAGEAPDPYKAGVEAFRAANATPNARAEERYKQERLAALAAEYAQWEATR